jgi:hypothetical protein
MDFNLLRKEVMKEWGRGWDRLSSREQQLELCKKFAAVVLSQIDRSPETLIELQALAKEVLSHSDAMAEVQHVEL